MRAKLSEMKAEVADPEEWLDLYGDRLYSFAMMRVRQRELAEDLVQDTLLSAYRNAEKFEGRSAVYTWLVSILKNKIIDHMRKAHREVSVPFEDKAGEETEGLFNKFGLWKADFSDWRDDPHDEFERKKLREQLEKCVVKLPDNHRQAFVLKVIDGVATEEVCELLGISPNNLWVILYRARMGLRKCLSKHWFDRQDD